MHIVLKLISMDTTRGISMSTITRLSFIRLIAVGAAATTFAQVASAQSTGQSSQSTNNPPSQHMGGGTQPGPGTHGHSSSPNPGETKEIQDQQHNMPATPSHSSTPGTK